MPWITLLSDKTQKGKRNQNTEFENKLVIIISKLEIMIICVHGHCNSFGIAAVVCLIQVTSIREIRRLIESLKVDSLDAQI